MTPGDAGTGPIELARSTEEEKQSQLKRLAVVVVECEKLEQLAREHERRRRIVVDAHEKTDPAVLRFGAADGREAIDLYAASKQRKGEFVLVRYVPQAALWVKERDAVALKQAFSRAIDLCRAAK